MTWEVWTTLTTSQVGNSWPSFLVGAHNPSSAHLRGIFPGPRPGGGGGGGGGFAFPMNRSSSPGGNTRTFILGRPRQADFGPDRVMPLSE
jgi:hypothetical protein